LETEIVARSPTSGGVRVIVLKYQKIVSKKVKIRNQRKQTAKGKGMPSSR